jgi:GNAT superfamily N-acetyltransferase
MNHRFATNSDVGLLAAMNARLIADEGHRNRMTQGELEKRMADWLDGDYHAALFDLDGKSVAYALFRPSDDGVYLRQFFVERERRREGIGRQALEILRRDVWPAGVRVTLEVLVGNQQAISFWRALGFVDYALTMELR